MQSPLLHQHVVWWGLEFILPSAPASDSDTPTSGFDGAQLATLSAQPSAAVMEGAAAPPGFAVAIMAATAPAPMVAPVACSAVQRPESNLLCDAARHERSGVLLL
jgi:hypothetical protein